MLQGLGFKDLGFLHELLKQWETGPNSAAFFAVYFSNSLLPETVALNNVIRALHCLFLSPTPTREPERKRHVVGFPPGLAIILLRCKCLTRFRTWVKGFNMLRAPQILGSWSDCLGLGEEAFIYPILQGPEILRPEPRL